MIWLDDFHNGIELDLMVVDVVIRQIFSTVVAELFIGEGVQMLPLTFGKVMSCVYKFYNFAPSNLEILHSLD